MRRYILILLVLLSFTACKIDQGTVPNPNRANELLQSKVNNVLYSVVENSRIAIYGDALLAADETMQMLIKSMWFNNVQATIEEKQIVINLNGNIYNDKYVITTSGKTFSEGAIWILKRTGASNDGSLIATFVGQEGVQRSFTYAFREESYVDTYHADIVVSYQLVPQTATIQTTLCGGGYVLHKEGEYSIHFTIEENNPLVFERSSRTPTSGKMEIVYKDLVDNKQLNLVVVYSNGYVNYK